MSQLRTGVVGVTCSMFVLMVAASSKGTSLAEQDGTLLVPASRRAAASDLEIRGLAVDAPRFVSRSSLLALPQAEAVVRPDENFTEVPAGGVKVRGVEFDVLLRALGIDAAARAGRIAVEAVCSDGYTPTYPPEYMQQHHPILALTVEGLAPSAWAEKTHTGDLGPYFVAYSKFVPSFHVLSHVDKPLVPVQMVRLEIAPQDRMFAGIKPPGAEKLRSNSPVIQGYRIAQQNCFRCHGAAGYGGTKSGRDWRYLAKVARKRPERFAAWVRNPQSIDAKSKMPPNLNYDRDTLTALTRYFAAFSGQISGRATSRGD